MPPPQSSREATIRRFVRRGVACPGSEEQRFRGSSFSPRERRISLSDGCSLGSQTDPTYATTPARNRDGENAVRSAVDH